MACSSLCFGKYPLDDALRKIRELEFQKVDLALHEGGRHLSPSALTGDLHRLAQHLRAFNLSYAAFHVRLGHTDAGAHDRLHAIGRLARLLTVPVLCVPAAPLGSDFDAEVERLADWSRVCTSEGVMLTVETHSQTLTADPAGAVELCKRVPGLGLTLDPSHYLVGPHRPENLDPLYPHVRHVRLRDSGTEPHQFQVRIGQGAVEYGRIISQLLRHGYDRVLTIDVRDLPDSPFPIEPEVRKLKYLLESLV
ncbi:MAG TPA: sugar phosphate isomerase/epimerase [Gemmataceae bacterium]